MPVTFKSKACADLLMLDSSAKQILKIIGKDALPKGIIEVAAIPAAIQTLKDAVEREKRQSTGPDQGQPEEAANQWQDKSEVSLAQRTWPFIEMLESAYAAGEPVVWGV